MMSIIGFPSILNLVTLNDLERCTDRRCVLSLQQLSLLLSRPVSAIGYEINGLDVEIEMVAAEQMARSMS